ncbi:MAG TPA: alpha/beta fold hydrolase [Falsiroseomonas sp.]|jgi:3-oxoadipate enol-lactonase|nr:alpha/beta fold hydrolase [Falsiroseomonas sp.]
MSDWTTIRIGPAPFICVDHAGDGELVLFMHGIGGNRTNWHDQLPAFAKHFHAAAWDARGYGGSDDYEGMLDFGSFAEDVTRVLDHLGAARAHIVGLSMGGRIAMDVAERFPDRILTLTLCDTTRGLSQRTPEQQAEFIRLRKEPLVNGKEPRDIAPVVARTLVAPNASEAAFQRLVDSMSALHKESYIKAVEASTTHPGATRLHEIKVPTHVVCGMEDRLTTPAMSREIAEMIPGAKLTLIQDAGHLSNIEKPAEFNEVVLGFLLEQAGR